jgi:hypothetical protein
LKYENFALRFYNLSKKKTMKIIVLVLLLSIYYVTAFTYAERAMAWARLQHGKGYSQVPMTPQP